MMNAIATRGRHDENPEVVTPELQESERRVAG